MKEQYEVQSSWKKLFRVADNYGEIDYDYDYEGLLVPLCFIITKDEVIMINSNPEEKATIEHLMISDDDYLRTDAIVYAERLF